MSLSSFIAEQYSGYEFDGGVGLAAFDEESVAGVDIVDGPITVDTVKMKDELASLDWVVDCRSQCLGLRSWSVDVGNLIVVELRADLVEPLAAIKDNCFMLTDNGWGWLVNREAHTVDIGDELVVCWIAERCSLDEVSLTPYLTDDGQRLSTSNPCKTVACVKARSVCTMELLDGIHREYIYKHKFAAGEVVAVSSVAGSGKTTMLLRLSQIHSGLRILYLAFNKSLVVEIGAKIRAQNIKNLSAMTFDALLWSMYCRRGDKGTLCDLKPQNIGQHIQWLQDKPFKLKNYYCKNFKRFCLDVECLDMADWCIRNLKKKDVILEKLWLSVTTGHLVTFETIRKQALIAKWFKDFIDKNYDMVLCDETQDFDMVMLRMLLDDTTVPKVFVGDPKQSIYDFRGCINAFKYMPAGASVIEFYSTFRVGEPACSQIRALIPDLWMISKAKGSTDICASVPSGVWLFRTWRLLLQTARVTRDIWIYGFESKLAQIRSLHSKLSNSWAVADDDEFEDDLPKFLKSISKEDLEQLIGDIERNMVPAEAAAWSMYTVHSYKGMENAFIRMAGDIIIEEENLYYVAITRGFQKIAVDKSTADSSGRTDMSSSSSPLVACDGKGRCIQECKHKQHIRSDYGANGYCPSSCAHKCIPERCRTCSQRRPRWILDGSKGQCFDCRIGL